MTMNACAFDSPTLDLADMMDGEGPDGGGQEDGPSIDPALQKCQLALASLRFDWDAGDQGFTHDRMPEVAARPANEWLFDSWERGQSTSGPGACRSGAGCWATNLDGNYASCQRAYLESPTMDLSACASFDISLELAQAFSFDSGTTNGKSWSDGGIIELSSDSGATWQTVTGPGSTGTVDLITSINSGPFVYSCFDKDSFYVDDRAGYIGNSGGWKQETIAIPAALRTSAFRLRFVYSSSAVVSNGSPTDTMQQTAPGWYLDDLAVTLDK